jgi:hypothetical protein
VNIYEGGMGGSGSGRIGWRRRVGSYLALDVRELARKGVLRPGTFACRTWSNSYGEQVGAIQMRAGLEYPDEAREMFGAGAWIEGLADHVRLIYSWTPNGGERQDFDYPVWLERTPCNYGGHRIWWLCPRCQKRRAVIYGGGRDGRFGCRGCMRLAYSVEALGRYHRLQRKADKLGARLLESDDGKQWLKPKGMHWRTFDALCERIAAAEEEKDAAWFKGAARLLARWGRLI